VQAALEGGGAGKYRIEYRALGLHDGVERWIRSTGQTLFEDGRPARFIGTAEDITAAKVTEADLHAAKDKAEEANRAKDEFLAMLGHELRNPLAPMLTALELLRVRLGEAGAQEREIIQRQVRNLVQLVDDLLDVAQIRKGKLAVEREALYARQIVTKALEVVTPTLVQRHHRLEVDIQPPSLVVMGDEGRLVQALTNLLTNAVKYTDPGGSISVAVGADEGEVQLRVRDSGRGIPPGLLPRVFDLFVQGERTPDRSEGGLGLGLPIVRSIAERHGGTVTASSGGPGKGSEFVIRLPASVDATPLPVARSLPPQESPGPTVRKVLIVDDNVDAAEALCALLADVGYSCEVAVDGPSGVDRVMTFDPEIVLLDIGLPHIDGYEVARRIRALPRGAHKLIVAVTGYGQEQDRQRSAQAGIDAHLVKPVDFDQLLRILQTMPADTAAQAQLEAAQ
jgi:signal transduction histidine kinase/ActR/RegA family two-component response regulator